MPSQFEQASSILQKAKEDVQLALQGHEHEGVGISITSSLTRLINQLGFMTGKNPVTNASNEFPPVTNFFGDPITRTPEVKKEDIKATPTEREIFLNKVAALQSTIRERQPETLISDFSNEPLVLRKVAKNAGLEDYESGIINIDFIERIKEGLTNNDTRALEEEKINEKLAGPTAGQLIIKGTEIDAKEAATTNDQLSTTKTVKQADKTKASKEGA